MSRFKLKVVKKLYWTRPGIETLPPIQSRVLSAEQNTINLCAHYPPTVDVEVIPHFPAIDLLDDGISLIVIEKS